MKTIQNHSKAKKAGQVLYPSLLALLMLFCSLSSWADSQERVKTKEFSKSFDASKSDNVYIDNRFGNITVTYWNKNEVSIRIVVEAKARNEERAQASIDRVRISMDKTGNMISAVTSLKEQNSGNNSNESFSIKYFVNMPNGITCDLNQKYGNINMPEDNKGKCMLHVKYGNINGGNFTGQLEVEAQYGNIEIGSVGHAELDLAYCGSSSLVNAGNLTVDSRYSTLNMQKVNKLDMEMRYGGFDIENLETASLDIKYSQGNIRYLKEGLDVELGYSTVNIREVSSNFKNIDAESHYGNLNINIPSNASFSVSAEGMKNGKYDISGFNVTNSHVEDKTDYTTEVNGGRGGRIEYEGNSYGSLKIRTR